MFSARQNYLKKGQSGFIDNVVVIDGRAVNTATVLPRQRIKARATLEYPIGMYLNLQELEANIIH
jgi:hypothetical protein